MNKKKKWTQLTPREKLITLSYAKGLRGLECAKDAGLVYKNNTTANASINRVMSHPAARDYVKQIETAAISGAEDNAILTLREKMVFCARVLRCKITKEPDDSDLWQEISTESSESSERTKRKLPDKRLIIELDNKLQGHGLPDPSDESPTDVLAKIIADLATAPHQYEKM